MASRLRVALATLLVTLSATAVPSAFAEGQVLRLDPRPGVRLPIFVERNPLARATAVLLSGGKGGFGKLENGRPSSENFLVRSFEHFVAAGFNVVVVGRSSDSTDWDNETRITAPHVRDLESVADFAAREFQLPIWFVGTSRGTVSATAAAIAFGKDKLAGVVLTSSITSYRSTGAVPKQDLAKIAIPVLVYHHARDGCRLCAPHETPHIIKGLENAPVKKLILADGGSNATGDPCEALHWHGFIGMEAEAVGEITAWMKAPKP